MHRINVLIADPCPVVVQGLGEVLGAQHNFKIVACCSDGMSCIEAIRSLRPDIAILEVSMPGLTGLEILRIVKFEGISTRVVFFTASAEASELVESAAADAYGVNRNVLRVLQLLENLIEIQFAERIATGRDQNDVFASLNRFDAVDGVVQRV